MSAKLFALIILAGVFVLIVELVRRERLTFKYAFGWMLAVLGGLLIVLAENIFYKVSLMLGFELLSNFIFFCCMGMAVILGLLLTVFLCQQGQRNESMAKKIAWLEGELDDLKLKDRT